MKKTYQKPASEVMNLGLKGEDIADSIVISSGTAKSGDDIDGGSALVKDGGAWDTDGLWN